MNRDDRGYEELVGGCYPPPGDVDEGDVDEGDEVTETPDGHRVHHRVRSPDEMVDK